MGLFDEVWFKCPQCKQSVVKQSKGADQPCMRTYTAAYVPTKIGAYILGSDAYCENCRRHYYVRGKKRISLWLSTQQEDEDGT